MWHNSHCDFSLLLADAEVKPNLRQLVFV